MNPTLKKIVFNRPVFYASIVLCVLVVIGLLVYGQFFE